MDIQFIHAQRCHVANLLSGEMHLGIIMVGDDDIDRNHIDAYFLRVFLCQPIIAQPRIDEQSKPTELLLVFFRSEVGWSFV